MSPTRSGAPGHHPRNAAEKIKRPHQATITILVAKGSAFTGCPGADQHAGPTAPAVSPT